MVEDEVPEIVVGALGLWNLIVWFRLASVDNIRELDCVLDEEDWDVVANNVPVALLGVELDGKATDVSHCVGAATASKHR